MEANGDCNGKQELECEGGMVDRRGGMEDLWRTVPVAESWSERRPCPRCRGSASSSGILVHFPRPVPWYQAGMRPSSPPYQGISIGRRVVRRCWRGTGNDREWIEGRHHDVCVICCDNNPHSFPATRASCMRRDSSASFYRSSRMTYERCGCFGQIYV